MTFSRHPIALLLASVAAMPGWAPSAYADATDRRNYELPSQPLGASLRAIAATSGRNIIAESATVDTVTAPALKGSFTAEEAVDFLLAGSGLRARRTNDALIIEPETGPASAAGESVNPDIIISGTRIRGAQVASPIIKLGREAIKSAGQATLPEALKTLPQNFGGGQNPGVGQNVPETRGADLGGGSSINLRGLGSDATLTLLDGHRLSYNAFRQSVDISGVPLGAVERIDVVPDGASALFGSDAVAGVVNIVLRRDLNGLETGFRLAGTSDGGNFVQLYNATAGKSWGSGSMLVAYEYGSNSAIVSNQRDYAAIRPNVTILPGMRRHSALATLRQDIAPGVTLTIDGLFNKRQSIIDFPLNNAGDLSVSYAHFFTTAQSYGIAPSLKVGLPGNWEAELTGSLGQDRTDYGATGYFSGTPLSLGSGYYRNRERSIELSGNGTLFVLPGGRAKLAIGIGYRRIDFLRFAGVGDVQNVNRSQIDTYGFGELSLPVAKILSLSAAARYENYRGIDQVVTPKFGFILSPTPDFSVKGSWGKSFRAPTLYQQYNPQSVVLYDISRVGGTGYPAGTTALYVTGGNRNVTPERSTNWSATLDIHPRALAGLQLELSYFTVAYRDRIVIPIPTRTVALASAIYASRITTNPSSAAQAALIASAGTFLNQTSGAYDPIRVGVIVDNSNVNAGRQTARGVDALLRYTGAAGPGKITASVDLAYITSKQQLGPGLAITPLAGTIFNPPHLRVRGDLGWTVGPLSIGTAVSYVGPVDDNRTATVVGIHGMTPADLTLRYRPDDGALRGLDLTVSVQNIFNAKPQRIATSLYSDTAYDSTNYSPIGRMFSIAVTKKW